MEDEQQIFFDRNQYCNTTSQKSGMKFMRHHCPQLVFRYARLSATRPFPMVVYSDTLVSRQLHDDTLVCLLIGISTRQSSDFDTHFSHPLSQIPWLVSRNYVLWNVENVGSITHFMSLLFPSPPFLSRLCSGFGEKFGKEVALFPFIVW